MPRLNRIPLALPAALAVVLGLAGPAAATCPDPSTVSPSHSDWGTVNGDKPDLVATRAGYLNGGYQVILRNSSNQPVCDVEVWIYLPGNRDAYITQPAGFQTICVGDTFPECPTQEVDEYAYIEGRTDSQGKIVFSQQFGGYGQLQITWLASDDCPLTIPADIKNLVNAVDYRSTDMNSDGKWDECDRAAFIPCLGATSGANLAMADFDQDGDVDAADHAILDADIVAAACSDDRTTCEEEEGSTVACGATVAAPGAISDLAVDWYGSTQVGLAWTSSGAQGAYGTASSFDLRYSTSPINSSNFSSATQVTGEPTPGASGTGHEMTVTGLSSCTTYYFAIKATNSCSNLTSNLSNTVSRATMCGGGGGSNLQREAPARLEFALRSANPAVSSASFRYAIPAGAAGERLDLGIFDASGRRVRTLATGTAAEGRFGMTWNLTDSDAQRVRAGVYFVRLTVGAETLTRSVVVLKD